MDNDLIGGADNVHAIFIVRNFLRSMEYGSHSTEGVYLALSWRYLTSANLQNY